MTVNEDVQIVLSVCEDGAVLVLSRKADEAIQIGGDVTVTIFRIKGNSVRIGIQAPKDVRIVRSELSTFEEEWSSEADGGNQRSLATASCAHASLESCQAAVTTEFVVE